MSTKHVGIEEYLADIRFHQCFHVDKRRVTYSDIGSQNDNAHVLLFCGAMLGGRYSSLRLDDQAREQGVRILCIDRPGFGGSDNVNLSLRMETWLQTVPALMHHLHIVHISLASHSAGTLYLFHTILHLPHILYPQNPYIALLGPWVHPKHSRVAMLSLCSFFPDSWVGNWHRAQKAIVRPLMWSTGIFAKKTESKLTKRELEKKALVAKAFEYIMAEDLDGAGQEALLCLKRGVGWGSWEEYEEICGQLRGPKITMDVFYAELDMMIGDRGAAWFDDMWEREGAEAVLDFHSMTVPGTSHESIVEAEVVWKRIFQRISK